MIPTDELHGFSGQLKPPDDCLETGIVENQWKLFMKNIVDHVDSYALEHHCQ